MDEIELLKREGQTQVLRYYDELSETQKEHLLSQVRSIDFAMIDKAMQPVDLSCEGTIQPYHTMTVEEWSGKKEQYASAGEKMLREGQAAAVVLAGGQGTRLGFDGPKGTLNVGVTRKLYLFQILLQNMRKNLRKAGGESLTAPFCVMTSAVNHEQTVSFFKEHQFFGYPEEEVFFFQQDMAPSLDHQGKILLQDKDTISMAPNGNGGWFTSLERSGVLEKLRARAVKWLNVVSVDNVLQNILDPVFLGACQEEGCGAGAKVIAKACPEEKVGSICTRGGKVSVVEYSELTDQMRSAKDASGQYLYHYGVTLNYLFQIDQTQKAASSRMPIHKANKILPYLDENGKHVIPDSPNGYKMEYFIFDILESFDKVLSFECVRQEEFAPIKNREGVDSLQTARKLYTAYTGEEL